MKYIVMCGGHYNAWERPRQLTPINGEPIIARTVRLLKENGVSDIAITSHDRRFEAYGPVLKHDNKFEGYAARGKGCWVDAFYPTSEPCCYLMGDVVFSKLAIRQIVFTPTNGVMFFASAPPFDVRYIKPYAEPFAFKVTDQQRFRKAVDFVRQNETTGLFNRRPIAWELWQVINGEDPNVINYNNYVVINDFTCDIDKPEDAERIARMIDD